MLGISGEVRMWSLLGLDPMRHLKSCRVFCAPTTSGFLLFASEVLTLSYLSQTL